MLWAGRILTGLVVAFMTFDTVIKLIDLQVVRDSLDQLIPGMSLEQYTKAMGDAMTAAKLAGRYEVLQEAGGNG